MDPFEARQDELLTLRADGLISVEEYNREVHKLAADMREAARETAWDAFSDELDRW